MKKRETMQDGEKHSKTNPWRLKKHLDHYVW